MLPLFLFVGASFLLSPRVVLQSLLSLRRLKKKWKKSESHWLRLRLPQPLTPLRKGLLFLLTLPKHPLKGKISFKISPIAHSHSFPILSFYTSKKVIPLLYVIYSIYNLCGKSIFLLLSNRKRLCRPLTGFAGTISVHSRPRTIGPPFFWGLRIGFSSFLPFILLGDDCRVELQNRGSSSLLSIWSGLVRQLLTPPCPRSPVRASLMSRFRLCFASIDPRPTIDLTLADSPIHSHLQTSVPIWSIQSIQSILKAGITYLILLLSFSYSLSLSWKNEIPFRLP